MTDTARKLADTYLTMLNTRNPALVNQLVAENYINHNAFVADGREPNREFRTAFFAAMPDEMFQQIGAISPLGAPAGAGA